MDWFVEHGYSESMGARPMARLVQEKLKKPLAEEILFGSMSGRGGMANVTVENDEIKINCVARENRPEKAFSSN